MVSRADSKFLKDPKDVFWPKKEKTTEKKIYDEILDAGIEANGYLCKIQDNNRIPILYCLIQSVQYQNLVLHLTHTLSTLFVRNPVRGDHLRGTIWNSVQPHFGQRGLFFSSWRLRQPSSISTAFSYSHSARMSNLALSKRGLLQTYFLQKSSLHTAEVTPKSQTIF